MPFAHGKHRLLFHFRRSHMRIIGHIVLAFTAGGAGAVKEDAGAGRINNGAAGIVFCPAHRFHQHAFYPVSIHLGIGKQGVKPDMHAGFQKHICQCQRQNGRGKMCDIPFVGMLFPYTLLSPCIRADGRDRTGSCGGEFLPKCRKPAFSPARYRAAPTS